MSAHSITLYILLTHTALYLLAEWLPIGISEYVCTVEATITTISHAVVAMVLGIWYALHTLQQRAYILLRGVITHHVGVIVHSVGCSVLVILQEYWWYAPSVLVICCCCTG